MHSALLFFTYIAHAVGHRPAPYRINSLTACQGYLCTRTGWMTGWGSAKHLWATTGVSTHRQGCGTRQLPLWRVVVSSRCSRLASAPLWERLPEISKSRNLENLERRHPLLCFAIFLPCSHHQEEVRWQQRVPPRRCRHQRHGVRHPRQIYRCVVLMFLHIPLPALDSPLPADSTRLWP
jgi:hypothetical protein